MQYVNEVLTLIGQHTAMAYGTIFLVSLSESLALVGLIVPGTMIMFSIGAVVSTGSLELKIVLLLAVAGAVAGDGISYWIGRRYQDELRQIWPFSRYPGMLQKGEIFFKQHGGKSVLFGRFVGPVRPVIPVVAGMLGMGPLHFSVVNVVSAVGWALVYILPGVFFGTSLAVAGAVSTRLAMLVFILLVAIWGFVWLSRKLVLLLGHKGPIWFFALKDWAASDTHSHRVMLPIKRLFSYLFLRRQGEELFLGFLVLVLFMAGWGFLSVLQAVLAEDPLVLVDQAVYHFFQSIRTPWADQVFVTITEFGDSFVNVCLSVAVLLVLLGKQCYRTAGFWILASLGGLAGVQLLKWLIHLPRPVDIYHGASAFGFPSGHTTMSVILYGFLAILLARRTVSGPLRWGMLITALLISFIIAISRLYLGAHWLSDVLGGVFIGTSWTVLLGIAYVKKSTEKVPRRLLGCVAICIVVVAGIWHVTQRHETDLAFYTPRYSGQTQSLSTWFAHGWRELPAWRIDMAGEREQPLTLQWVGSPDALARYLLTKGWQRSPVLNLKNFLGIFSPDTSIEKLPVLPRLHTGRLDRLCMVRRDREYRQVLSLWPSDISIGENKTPLFLGTIEVQQLYHLTGLITVARDTGEYDRSLETLKEDVENGFALKIVTRTGSAAEYGDRRLHWQAEVLLLWNEAEIVGYNR